MSNDSWIKLGEKEARELADLVAKRSQARILAGDYTVDNVGYISALDLRAVKQRLAITKERLERLRRLCQVWDVKMLSKEITSHRRVIGPIIVTTKKLFRPLIHLFLKDTLHQQRTFNGEVLSLTAALTDDVTQIQERLKKPENN